MELPRERKWEQNMMALVWARRHEISATLRCGVAATLLVIALSLVVGAAACAETLHHRIDVDSAWVRRPTRTRPEALAFFEIVNYTDKPEYLIGVSSQGGEGKLSELRWRGLQSYVARLKSIQIPPQGRVELKAGGYFVTLQDSGNSLLPGKPLILTLHFASAGSLEVAADVSNHLLGKAHKQ